MYNSFDKSFLKKIIVIDIETVPKNKHWGELSPSLQNHWIHKSHFLRLNEEEINDPALSFSQRAGIYAEFGKIVCIGLGVFNIQEDKNILRLKSIANDDELLLLSEFNQVVSAFEKRSKNIIFCGHNIKEFDLPYICRRMLVNELPLPNCLQLSGLKPWQIEHQDTLEMWRFGDYKHYISLDLLANSLGAPSSKTEMNGSEVGSKYWNENALPAISKYCLQDVHTTAEVFLKLKGINTELTIEYA